jgi:hypothetical protein
MSSLPVSLLWVRAGTLQPAVVGACAAILLILAGPSLAQVSSPDPLVARVDGIEIRESDVRVADHEFGNSLPIVEADLRRQQIINYLTNSIILSRAALKRDVADDADIQRRIAFIRNKALMENLLIVTARSAATETAVRKAYDEFVATTGHEPELRLSAVTYQFSDPKNEGAVREAKDKAEAALRRINAGEDFKAVAKETSEDPTVKANGGDLGYRTRAEMGKEYAEVAFTLDIGGVSKPIWTQFGWHLIKLEDRRERKPPEFAAVRDSLQGYVMRRAQRELVTDLRSQATIERLDQQDKSNPAQAEKPSGAGK